MSKIYVPQAPPSAAEAAARLQLEQPAAAHFGRGGAAVPPAQPAVGTPTRSARSGLSLMGSAAAGGLLGVNSPGGAGPSPLRSLGGSVLGSPGLAARGPSAAASAEEDEAEMLRLHGWCGMYEAGDAGDDAAAEARLRGVARNFAAVHRAAKTLGGVPEMLSAADCSEHGPDEKVRVSGRGLACACAACPAALPGCPVAPSQPLAVLKRVCSGGRVATSAHG